MAMAMAMASRAIKKALYNPHISHSRALSSTRSLHSDDIFGNGKGDEGVSESLEDFERRLLGSGPQSRGGGVGDGDDSFFRKLDRSGRSSEAWLGARSRPDDTDGDGGVVEDMPSDGMEDRLKRAAVTYDFENDSFSDFDEAFPDFEYRPGVTYFDGATYTAKDLDLTKPAIQKRPPKRAGFDTTTTEVLQKADFRNVRFLANFLTEAGNMHKRRQFNISAKAMRKVAREIKTARAFGLLPFTTMGTKPFVFGVSMEDLEKDDEYEEYDDSGMIGGATDPLEER